MTDLEHDLKELFHDKADHLDTPAAAPQTVLRRGRRRQARTVAGGVLAGILALVLAVAAVGAVTRAPQPRPADTSTISYPERTTSIEGFTVTAPRGWTLEDLWPWSSVLTTSAQRCSFSGSGTPVGASGSPVAQPSQDCTTTPQSVPGGVPVLQLTNFDPGLSSTLCGLGDQPPMPLPDTGVAFYVTALSEGQSVDSLRQACPNADRIETDLGGPIPYALVSFVGDRASQADAAWIRDWGTNAPVYDPPVVPTAVQPSRMPGPGYVVAAGPNWRLEAVSPFGCRQDACRAQAVLVDMSADGEESPIALNLPVDGQPVVAADTGFVTGGTADTTVAAISVPGTLPNGETRNAPATMVRWPAWFQTRVPATRDGWLWWAEVQNATDVTITGTNGATYSIDNTSAPTPTAGGRLPTTTNPDGSVTGTLDALGRSWDIVANPDGTVMVGSTAYTIGAGSGAQVDVLGGTLLLDGEDTTVADVSVRVDGGGTIHGWWMPVVDRLTGKPIRLWVVPLAGTGTGVELIQGQLPLAVSWPTNPYPRPGAQIMGGGDGSVTWSLSYGNPADQCLQVRFVAGDTARSGSTDCLGSPIPGAAGFDYVAGERYSLVVVAAPKGSDVTTDRDAVYPQCTTMPGGSGSSSGMVQCVAAVPVTAGDVTFRVTDAKGDPVQGSPFTLRAEPGRLVSVQKP